MKNALAIIAMFACTSICFGDPPGKTITIDSDRGWVRVAGNSDKADGTANDVGIFPLDPNNCTLIIKKGARVGEASGAYINKNSNARSATGNKLIVHGGDFRGRGYFRNNGIGGACSLVSTRDVDVNGNTVEINAGDNIGNVFGGYTLRGTVFGNKVFINNKVTIGGAVYGGYVHNNGNANNNKVTITGTTVGGVETANSGDVFGGFVGGNGNAENNKVTITDATVSRDVCGGCVHGNGNANNNEVAITDTTVNRTVYGGGVHGNGNAEDNKVTIDGGSIGGNVYGGYVDGFGNGNATGNTITIIRTPKFGNNTKHYAEVFALTRD